MSCGTIDIDNYDLPLHIGAIAILVGTSLVGSLSPVLLSFASGYEVGYHSTYKFIIRLGLLFGAGTILSTGFIHMLIPAVLSLTSSCLDPVWSNYYTAFAGLFAMIAMFLMQLMQFSLQSYFYASHNRENIDSSKTAATGGEPFKSGRAQRTQVQTITNTPQSPVVNLHVDQNCLHTHNHPTAADTEDGKSRNLIATRKQITVLLLETGIVIIGIALGVASGSEFTALLTALCFHQFFEGLALGSTIAEAAYGSKIKSLLMASIYGLTTPLGIGLGIAIRSTYSANSASGLLTQGIFDSISAGILIYTAIVEFLTLEITHSEPFRDQSLCRQASQFMALYLGAATMAIIGRYV